MFTKLRRHRQLRKVKTGDGSALKKYRFWQPLSRSLFYIDLETPPAATTDPAAFLAGHDDAAHDGSAWPGAGQRPGAASQAATEIGRWLGLTAPAPPPEYTSPPAPYVPEENAEEADAAGGAASDGVTGGAQSMPRYIPPTMPAGTSADPSAPQPGTNGAAAPHGSDGPHAGTPHAATPRPDTPHAGTPRPGIPHAATPHADTPRPDTPRPGTPHAGTTSTYAVDVHYFADDIEGTFSVLSGPSARTPTPPVALYRDGIQIYRSSQPAALPVPGGVIEVATSLYGLTRMHYVPEAGDVQVLRPHPVSAEGLRARFGRRFPSLSRAIGVAAILILLVGLVVVAPQTIELITQLDMVAERVGTFTSPIQLPTWANISLTVAGVLAAMERALTLRNHWLIDADTTWASFT